ncbi:MAG: hypothetical protein WCK51_01225 [Armatimonadota bacterium]
MIDWNRELTPGLREWFRLRGPHIRTAATLLLWTVQLIMPTLILANFSQVGWGGLERGAEHSQIEVWVPVISGLIGLGGVVLLTTFLLQQRRRLPSLALLMTIFFMMGNENCFKVLHEVISKQEPPILPSQPFHLYVCLVLGICSVGFCTWVCLNKDFRADLELQLARKDAKEEPPTSQSKL